MNTRFKINDGRRSTNFGIIPLVSSSKVWFMDTDDLKIIGLLITIFVPAIASWLAKITCYFRVLITEKRVLSLRKHRGESISCPHLLFFSVAVLFSP